MSKTFAETDACHHLFLQEVATPVEGGAAEETTLLTGPIQGDVVTINQKPLDLMLLQVAAASLCCVKEHPGRRASQACLNIIASLNVHCRLCKGS